MEKHLIQEMTFKEIEGEFKKNPIILIPLGSIEEHGPHTPIGDFRAATEVAKRAAIRTDALVTPTIPFGYSEYFKTFPGTISIRPETFIYLLEDVIECLLVHNLDHLLILNGHGGNASLIEQVVRRLRSEKKLIIPSLNLWQLIPSKLYQELFPEIKGAFGHGGEPMTSIFTYLTPGEMRMDLLPQEIPQENTFQGFKIQNLSQGAIGDLIAQFYFDMKDISEDGIMGNPRGAKPGRGEVLLETVVERISLFIEKFKKMDTLISSR